MALILDTATLKRINQRTIESMGSPNRAVFAQPRCATRAPVSPNSITDAERDEAMRTWIARQVAQISTEQLHQALRTATEQARLDWLPPARQLARRP